MNHSVPPMRGRDVYDHANTSGTGSACRFELHPARGDSRGAVYLELARQLPDCEDCKFPAFDWENRILVKLCRQDIAEILMTLKGLKVAAGGSEGLLHRTPKANTAIKFKYQVEPEVGYALSVSRKVIEGELKTVKIIFSIEEAFALTLTLEQAMMYVCLGVPACAARRRS